MKKTDLLLVGATALIFASAQAAYLITKKLKNRHQGFYCENCGTHYDFGTILEVSKDMQFVDCVRNYIEAGNSLKDAVSVFKIEPDMLEFGKEFWCPKIIIRGVKNKNSIEKIADDACMNVTEVEDFIRDFELND